MLILNALQSYYESSGDRRVLQLPDALFPLATEPPEAGFLSDWRRVRKGDNLESVYWLYNRTGEPWLLDLATKIHRWGADWSAGIPTSMASISPRAFASRPSTICKAATGKTSTPPSGTTGR